jgi:putative NADH-flavin reductase
MFSNVFLINQNDDFIGGSMEHLKIAIVGGNGKVGKHIAKIALESGFQVRQLVRNPTKGSYDHSKIEIVKGDARNIKSIQALLEGCHIVINTLGQPVKEEPIYSTVTSSIITTMNGLGIRRYIGVTGASLDVLGDKKSMVNTIGAKIFKFLFSKLILDKEKELEILKKSELDWTLVRLPFVVEGPQTGYIKENTRDVPGTKIMNADIAHFLIQQIHDNKYLLKTPFIAN